MCKKTLTKVTSRERFFCVVTHCGTTAAGGVVPPPRIRFTGCFLETNNIVDVDEDIIKGVEARRYRSYKMGDIIVKQDNGQIAQIDYVEKAKRYLQFTGVQLQNKDYGTFIEICQAMGLNPFLREIYAVSYKDKYGNLNTSIITGYEVYIKRAMRTGLVQNWKAWTEGNKNDGTLKGCIKIKRADWTEAFYMEVYFDEYDTGRNLWVTKPRTMIEKVAIAQGFRRCFPEEMGGMPYTKDEMGVVTRVIKTADGLECEVVDEAQMQSRPQPQPQPQPAQPQPQNPNEAAKQIQEAINLIWETANKHELTEQDRKFIADGLKDRRNHTKGYFKQILDWLHHKPMKQGAA